MALLPPRPAPTIEAIYAAYESDAGDSWRDHLGASLIGKECERALWYDFRWVTRPQHSGRILRLFETGQLEEARIVRNLRRTSATVLEVDPETGRQWRVEAHGGHFAGSLDAVAIGLIEAPKTWHVVEFKTHSTQSFAELKRDGVQRSKPRHWAQMQVYLHLTGITRAMYVAVCKDTDEIYIERLPAGCAESARLLAKAERVISAQHPPPRISDDPSWWQCRLCEHHSLCHEGAAAEITCRSCLHSTPVEGGWHCARWDWKPSSAEQRRACERHLYIPDLVPGEVLDAGEDSVVYRMRESGAVWINGDSAAAEASP
jgi:hypothetical protein